MPRRQWLAAAMLATGASLVVSAQLAGAASDRRGGVFRVGATGASVQVDPQLSYITTGWWLEYATAAKLYNYTPKGTLVPEVASRFKVSNGGTRYTFFIRKGFRFSDGTPVTAASFKYAINRAANNDLNAPAAQFITDFNGVDIVGAEAVTEGRTTDVSGVRARGNRLIVNLTRNNGGLLTVLAMPFFQATSTSLPLDREVADVRSLRDLPSAGPYAFALNDVNRLTQLRRNPFWKRGPGRTVPRNLDGIDVNWNLSERAAFDLVNANQLDLGPIPAAEVQNVANQYGVNRSRFWVKATDCLGRLAFNGRAGLFKNNAAMRRAVNWALDRTDYTSAVGHYLQTPWTHFLLPGFPGSVTRPSLQPYGVRSNLEKARQIAAGHYRDGRVVVAYRSAGVYAARAQLVRRDLIALGLEVQMVPAFDPLDVPPTWDILVGVGYGLGVCYDNERDPAQILRSEIEPYRPESANYSLKIQKANALKGSARLNALGKLDLEIARKLAPIAVMHTYNNRYFFSARVDPRSLKYHRVYHDWSITALALK
jgi:ABC-type oligopeptide transport system substrate-binding subunit